MMKLCQRIYVHSVDFEDNFIFNGLTGSIDLANSKIAKFLKSKDMSMIDNLEKEEIDELIKSGYLIEEGSNISEKFVYDTYIKSLGDRYENNYFVICPTLDCNLCCPYCFEHSFADKKAILDDDKLDRLFDFILERIKENPKQSTIELFGGEPLLKENYDIVQKIFEFANINHIDMIITTNGTQLTEFLDLFDEYKDILKKIQVTLDGDKSTHDKRRIFKDGSGSFDIILENAEKILDMGIDTDMRVNIDKSNIGNIEEMVNDVIDDSDLLMYDNFSYYFSTVTDHHNLDNENMVDEADLAIALDKLNLVEKGSFPLLGYLVDSITKVNGSRLPSFSNCEANSIYNYIITPDGNVFNCPEAIQNDNYKTWSFYPETRKYSFENKGFYQNILTDESRKDCNKCNIALLCGGGCVLVKNNKAQSGHFCKMQKKAVDKYLNYLRGKLALC
ncbi:radical SAM protein [Clostridiaceae bacterium M8S5]|nr:radical SAM protein [Clostridiaceae bacterium M8S5]